MAEVGVVRLVRRSASDIKMRDLYVRIDDGPELNVKYLAEVEVPVAVGAHTVHATNRLYKRRIDFELAKAGDEITFEVANTAKGCAGVLFTMGFGPYQVELRRTAE
ncbi:MAG: hypothetical protein ACYC96_16830 [Fimbriimonadaceae bacterium]